MQCQLFKNGEKQRLHSMKSPTVLTFTGIHHGPVCLSVASLPDCCMYLHNSHVHHSLKFDFILSHLTELYCIALMVLIMAITIWR